MSGLDEVGSEHRSSAIMESKSKTRAMMLR